jgi:hypothetical protein
MKALLFTLLLLFIVISPSLTAPSSETSQSTMYRTRQRIIYTIFTESGVFNIELLWDPETTLLTRANFGYTEIRPEAGYTQVSISQRRLDRWILDAGRPRASVSFIRANIIFIAPPNAPLELGHASGVLSPGVSIIPLNTVSLSQLARPDLPRKNAPHQPRLQVHYLVLMTILTPGALDLDPQTVHGIQSGELRRYIESFFQQGTGPLSSQLPPLPLRLDPRIWRYLLTNRIGEYGLGAITGAPPTDPNPRPHPNQGCRGTSSRSRRRRPDDQDDPEAEREGKRQCQFDLNEEPEDQGEARGANQGDQQVPVRTARTGFFSAFLDRFRTIGRYAKQAIQLLGRERFNPPPLTSAQKKNKEIIDALTMARFWYGGQYGTPSFH